MSQASRILPLMLQTLEKAEKQPNQQQLMSEAVSASCLLVKLAAVDIQAGELWTTVIDSFF